MSLPSDEFASLRVGSRIARPDLGVYK